MNSVHVTLLSMVLTGATALASIDSGLLNLVMPDAKIMSGIQVDQAVSSPLAQYLLNQMQPNDPGFLKFIAETGFDPRYNLTQILAATSANNTGLAVGRGTFQIAKIESAATARGGTIAPYHGVDILTGPTPGSTVLALFPDGTTVAIGDLASVQAAIDRRGSNKPSADPVLIQKAQNASTTNQAWFATTTPLSDFLNGKLDNSNLNNISQNNLFQSIQQASGGMNFASGGVVISADAVTSSDQNAQALVDVLKFLITMVPANNPQLKSLADAATFTANGSTAHISLSLSEQQAEQLIGSDPNKTARARRH